MSWNYRIIYHKAGYIEDNPKLKWDEYLAIHEAYYDNEGKINNISKHAVSIVGDEGKDSLSSIKQILQDMTEALQKPIINYDNLKEIDKEKQNDFSKSIKIEKQISTEN